ncbi:spore coat protein U domain-containing protein [Pseudomonas sp. RIT-To-2]|uniref:spore coat protein U domain-containing protein n=1 Tax=Pseudomonas sp. RIT-To-2 TaxID=3462541 RepID=UPI0024138617
MRHLLFGLLLPLSPAALAHTCTVASTPLLFGTVAGVAGQVHSSTANVTVTCEAGATAAMVTYSLYVDDDGGLSHDLHNGSGTAQYRLYTAAGHQPVLGGQAFASDSYTLAAHASTSRTYTLYARLQPGRDGAPGVYQAMSAIRLVY